MMFAELRVVVTSSLVATHGFQLDTNKAQKTGRRALSVLESVQKSERVESVAAFRYRAVD